MTRSVWVPLVLALGLAATCPANHHLEGESEDGATASMSDSASGEDSEASEESSTDTDTDTGASAPLPGVSAPPDDSDPEPASESAPTAPEEPLPEVTPARTVANASSWSDIKGPLAGLFDRWRAEQAAQGIQWDDQGHIINPEGAQFVGGFQAEAVPAEAVQWIVANAAEAGDGLLVAASSAEAGQKISEEAGRVRGEAAARTAEEAARAQDSQPAEDDAEAQPDGEQPIEPDEGSGVLGDDNEDPESSGAPRPETVPNLETGEANPGSVSGGGDDDPDEVDPAQAAGAGDIPELPDGVDPSQLPDGVTPDLLETLSNQ